MKYFSILVLLGFPSAVFAAVNNVFDVEVMIIALLGQVGYLFWLAAIMAFFWGLVKFIKNAADTKEHEEGKNLIIWGLIAFLVLFSIWAIVKFFFDTIGIINPDLCYVDKSGVKICP